MKIPDPAFELHELVTLHYGKDYQTRIVKRYFNPDKDGWLFKVHCFSEMVGASLLSPRN